MRARAAGLWQAVTGFVDGDDILVLTGLAGGGAGVWFVFPPAAAIVVGGALVALGVLRSRGRRAR